MVYLSFNQNEDSKDIITIFNYTNTYSHRAGTALVNIANFDVKAYVERFNSLAKRALNKKIDDIEKEYASLKQALVELHPYFNIITYEEIQKVVIDKFLYFLTRQYTSINRKQGQIDIKVKKPFIDYEKFSHSLSLLCIDASQVDSVSLYKSFLSPTPSMLHVIYWDYSVCFFQFTKKQIDLQWVQDISQEWIDWILDTENKNLKKLSLQERKETYCDSNLFELGIVGYNNYLSSNPQIKDIKSSVSSSDNEVTFPDGEPNPSDLECLVTHTEEMLNLEKDDFINGDKTYIIDSLESAINLELKKMVYNNIGVKKCDCCGKYYVLDHSSKYCNSCRKNNKGARKNHSEKIKNDPILLLYETERRRRYAEYYRGKVTIVDFDEWAIKSNEYKEKAILGEITKEEYIAKLKE